jgi:6-phosphogluconolactonase
MPTETKIFADPAAVAVAFATDFAAWVNAQSQSTINIALSGGSTPKILFELWARDFADNVDWSRIHFFWGDERCVPADDSDSNYGVAKKLFLDKVGIAASNIHHVFGATDPMVERSRYENEITSRLVCDANSIPQFDLIIVGMGSDGHTASIFPHESQFLESDKVIEIATHPQSGQKRLTLTGPVINRAKKVAFLITGTDKASVLAQVIHKTGNYANYPASHIQADDLTFYIDQSAARDL